MAARTEIAWCDSTWNPWIGCTKVGPGCDHCYAERDMDIRRGRAKWGPGQPRSRTSADYWKQPLRWNRREFFECEDCGFRGEGQPWEDFDPVSLGKLDDGHACEKCGSRSMEPARRRVFCASLADVFDNEVPSSWRAELFSLIRATPNLDWLLLTKRIGNAVRMIDEAGGWLRPGTDSGQRNPIPNVWLGATVVNQSEADRDIPKLLATPAAVRFVSIEPMLGPLDVRWAFPDIRTACCHRCGFRTNSVGGICPNDGEILRGDIGVDWIVAGGESGPGARRMEVAWARQLRDQCASAGVPFLFKQWGEWAPYGRGQDDPKIFVNPATMDAPMQRFGKKLAGRMLDGRVHNEFPKAA